MVYDLLLSMVLQLCRKGQKIFLKISWRQVRSVYKNKNYYGKVLSRLLCRHKKGYKMEAQVEISQWLGQVAGVLPFGYAFGAGMVSAVNPCGFAMLPVYLTLYLGAKEDQFREKSFFL